MSTGQETAGESPANVADGSPLSGVATTTVTTTAELSMGNTAELNALDLKNPFVTVQVDSNRINVTFTAILDALQDVRVVVSNLTASVEGNKANIAAVQSDVADFKKAWQDDPRFAELNEKATQHNNRIAALEEQLAMMKARLNTADQRMAKQESKSVDLNTFGNQLQALQKDVLGLNESQTGMQATQDGHTESLEKLMSSIAQGEAHAAEADELIKAVYTIFEMNQAAVLQLVKDPKQSEIKRQDTKLTGLTEYVLGLPSFKTMYADFKGDLGAVNTRLTEDLYTQKKKLAEESVLLRSKIGVKLDTHRFTPLLKEVELLTKRVGELDHRMDKMIDELNTKAALATVQKMHDHLDQVKADKADLVGLLHRDDLIPLERDIQQLAEAIDRSSTKLKLDINKNRALSQQPRPTPPQDQGLYGKLVNLEGDFQTIKEDYVRKGDLGDVYMYVDNNLAKLQARLLSPSSTPGLTQSDGVSRPTSDDSLPRPSTGKNRPLQPVLRQPSAGRSRLVTPRHSIPAEVRSPSPPIRYTSTPATYVPNPAKYRATASLFHSDGCRSTATVTAAVPIVDHWHNVARVAAGVEVVPPSMKVHTMYTQA